MGLYRWQDGLIFEDNFVAMNDRWTFSPGDKCVIENEKLRLSHSINETTALFDLPNSPNLLIEVGADYVPTVEGDEGGIVIWKSAITRLDFLESVHTTTGEYAIWRAKKEGNEWFFYAKKNGQWEFIDNAPMVGVKAGVVLKGYGSNFVDMQVNRVIVCESDSFKILNIDERFRVDIYDEQNNLKDSYAVEANRNWVEIFLEDIPFTGYIKLFKDGELIDETELIMIYGGDIFTYSSDLDIVWNGAQLTRYSSNYLGKLRENELAVKMSVVNNTDIEVLGVTLVVKQYKQDVGYTFVDIALDISGEPGEFGDSVLIGDLSPGASRDFWIKIVRTDFDLFNIDPLKFKIDVLFS